MLNVQEDVVVYSLNIQICGVLVDVAIRKFKHATFFEPRMETGSAYLARQRGGLSQIFKVIVSISERTLDNRSNFSRFTSRPLSAYQSDLEHLRQVGSR